ncbi:hypothetical protein HPB48_017307 [Haemaphysalis longicornis]|uniref:AMP-binding enzyme C-terminal domain-containing protein n=1 Tax=Haemaphysalis longicornis TaxID=44386 RepID=A0A9J6FZP0_HAELO|nr:hypothetical protein HPB48_017307 [Haemaphysalis longicornis]
MVQVIDKSGKPLGPGQCGELVLRSPGLMCGYWGRLDEPVTDANGWYRTGDVCYYDEDEWLYLVERLSEFIHCRDRKVPPAAIEAVLFSCAQVQDCAVVGLPDPEVGQLPHAVVVPIPGCDDLAPCHFQQFADAKLPRSLRLEGGVTVVGKIPRNKLGKLDAVLLRQLQVGARWTPVWAVLVTPEQFITDQCAVCRAARATMTHIMWECNDAIAETNILTPHLARAVRKTDKDAQKAAAQFALQEITRQQSRPAPPS